MGPIYFRHTENYLLEDLPFLAIQITETDLIEVSEVEWVSYALHVQENRGEIKRYLRVFIRLAENNELVNSLFENRSALSEIQRQQLDQFISARRDELRHKAQNALRRLRWLTGLNLNLNLWDIYVPLEWSRDLSNWETVPTTPPVVKLISIEFVGITPTNTIDRAFLDNVLAPNARIEEPLGHDLLLEANRLFATNDIRGAFLLGFSALEVGVKEFIAKKVPKAAWLAANAPSPNILELCNIYLPTLDKRLTIDGTLEKKLILKFMESRNALAHRGAFKDKKGEWLENRDTVLKKLRMVEYMLYRLDYCLGLVRAEPYMQFAQARMQKTGLESVLKGN